MIVALPILMALATPAATLPDVRIVVSIGNNIGDGRDQPLDYAEEDARRFHRLMTEIGGVSEDRAYLLLATNTERVRRVLNEVRGRIKELGQRQRTSLIVFVSAHADAEQLHLAGTLMPFSELQDLVRTSAADLKLTVIDACRTAAPSRYKGGHPAPEIAVTFETPSRVDGNVVITSASAGEPAQERAFLRGALFAHHLMTGLRGAADVDDDGTVSLTEVYAYAYRRTAADAVEGGAAQHPSFDVDTRGFGAWTLTRPRGLGAGLVLEQGIEGTVWIANRKRELVAEVAKSSAEVVRLALTPGWYRVVRPDGASAHVADINLGWGGERTLKADDFVRTRLSVATLKGADAIVLRPWQLGVGYSLGANPLPGSVLVHMPLLRLAHHLGPWQLRVSTTFATNRFRTPNLSVRNWTGGVALGGAYGLPWSWFTVGAALEMRLAFVRQTVERDDGPTLERVFSVVEPARQGLIVGALAGLFWEVPIQDRWVARIEAGIGLDRVPRFDGSSTIEPSAAGTLIVAWCF